MRESARGRFGYALLFGALAGLVVAFYNPAPHIKADLRADGHGVKLSLELAAHAIERACARV
jgi:hypothetical protein